MLAEGKFPIMIDDKKGKNIHPLEVIEEEIDKPIEIQLEKEVISMTNEPMIIAEEIGEKTKDLEDSRPSTPDISKLPSTSLGIGLCSVIPYGTQNAPILWHEKLHKSKQEMKVLKIV